ncbi:hypothetical protein AAFX91_10715 [Bradyrhizobium sp. 31Argb]|uniref:hypothetical protein n=1 Tax=unclassified Bradyrhizobium TaxID=2631580 RepID=UPI00102E468D|nr:hypothetical protein [Bradyrhizobium sp. Leo170]TAI65439.1 hypothetical protein CWO89_13605 [Bradyrhizobium sp. Leo170]
MALHRDIYWIGRQWAVTGFGMQLIDQRHGGKFDIEIARLWDEGLAGDLGAQTWFDPVDFGKGLWVARQRHTKPPVTAEVDSAAEPPPVAGKVEVATTGAGEPPPQKTTGFQLRIAGSAKFLRPWRVRMKR